MDVTIPEGFTKPIHPHKRPGKTARTKRRMRIRCDGGADIAVLDWWQTGFAIDVAAAPLPRGNIQIFVDEDLACHGLAYPTGEADGRRKYAFKRVQDAAQKQPRDYTEARPEVAGLISGNR